MSFLPKIQFYLRTLFQKRKLDEQLSEEIKVHVEMATEANVAQGMTPEGARYAALREFGNVAIVQERAREARGWFWLEQAVQDLRYATRTWRQQPGFTLTVTLILALGIGANTTVFALLDGLIFRSLPVPEPERLVRLVAAGPQTGKINYPYPLFGPSGSDHPAFPYPYAAHLAGQKAGLSHLIVASGWYVERSVRIGAGEGLSESLYVEEVSGNYFEGLGIRPVLGRTLTQADDQPGRAAPVAVISHSFWLRRFGGDPAVLGQTIAIDHVPLTIIGVADRGFGGVQVGGNVAAWVPIQLSPQIDANAPWGMGALQSDSIPWVHILGRLEKGTVPAQARAVFDQAYQNKLAELDPQRKTAAAANLTVQRLQLLPAGSGYGGLRPQYEQATQVLFGMVGIMQLVACINVAGLLLARGAARQREMTVRAALGASRGRLIRQVLTECLLLGVCGGAVGLFVAWLGMRAANGIFAGGLELAFHPASVGFAVGLTLLTTLLVGAIPALTMGRRSLSFLVRAHGGASLSRFGAGLVVVQVGFALVLLVVAGLLTRTLQNLERADVGFTRSGRLLADLNLPQSYELKNRTAFYRRAIEAVQRLPGVTRTSVYQGIGLLGENSYVHSFALAGQPNKSGEPMDAEMALVSADFFPVMGIPLVRGRAIDEFDGVAPGRTPALVISEWSARELFGDADPLGRRVKIDNEYEVVGVARDVKFGSVRDPSRFVFYAAMAQRPNTFRATIAVHFSGAITGLPLAIESRLRQEEPLVQLSAVRTITDRLAQWNQRDRLLSQLSMGFGLFALVLSGAGLFGLLAYTVGRRTREIGIRVALGATQGSVLGLVTRQGLGLALGGILFGVATAIGVTRLLQSFLFGIGVGDPLVYSIAAGALLGVGALACWLPARRAAKVDPVIALRAE